MIKFKNILFESSGDDELDNKVNRKYLYLIDRHNPDIREKTDIYLNHHNNEPYNKQNFYFTIKSFLEKDLMLMSSETNIILFLWILNYKVNNFLTDNIDTGKDIFLCSVQYTGDEIEYDYEDVWEDCYDCEGSGSEREECQFCGGSGEIEDPDGEEGDTLVCDDCDGLGYVDQDCSTCGGEGGWDQEEEYDIQDIYFENYILTNKISDDIYYYKSIEEFFETIEPLIYCKMHSRKYRRDSRTENMGAEDELEDLHVNHFSLFDIKFNVLG